MVRKRAQRLGFVAMTFYNFRTFGGSLIDQDPLPNRLTRNSIFKELEIVLGQFDFHPISMFPLEAFPVDGVCAYHGGFAVDGCQTPFNVSQTTISTSIPRPHR